MKGQAEQATYLHEAAARQALVQRQEACGVGLALQLRCLLLLVSWQSRPSHRRCLLRLLLLRLLDCFMAWRVHHKSRKLGVQVS